MGYTFDSDQLPELPDPGPRDGRHGVDRDDAYDPFPVPRPSEGERAVPSVSVEDARRHLRALLTRVENGEEIVLTRAGRPVARLVGPETAGATILSETIVAVSEALLVVSETIVAVSVIDGTARRWAGPRRTVPSTDDGDQLPALPDPGPRDGRHGVDDDRGYPFGG